MPLSLIIALIIAVASVFGASRLVANRKSMGPPLIGQFITLSDIEGLSEEQIGALLARLELIEEPEAVFGAMCYEPVAAPQTVDYICPVCGEKTVYSNYQYTEFLEWELNGTRRLFDEVNAMTDMELLLDESRYCEFCSPSEEDFPSLHLTVVHEDSSISSSQVSHRDMRMLADFLKGKLFFDTWNDGQEPLRPHIDRIRELLDLSEE